MCNNTKHSLSFFNNGKKKKEERREIESTDTHIKKGNKFKTKNKKKIIIINKIQSSNKTSQAFIDSFDFN